MITWISEPSLLTSEVVSIDLPGVPSVTVCSILTPSLSTKLCVNLLKVIPIVNARVLPSPMNDCS